MSGYWKQYWDQNARTKSGIALCDYWNRSSFENTREAVLGAVGGSSGRLLDVGCGDGVFASHFARKGFEVTAIDFSEEMIKVAKSAHAGAGIDFHVANLDSLPFEDDSFDVITCIGVLQYTRHPQRMIDTFLRLLKKDRHVVLVTLNGKSPMRVLGRYWARTPQLRLFSTEELEGFFDDFADVQVRGIPISPVDRPAILRRLLEYTWTSRNRAPSIIATAVKP